MTDLVGKPVDLGTWLQWYAFDAIGAITFSSRFGFMEERRDIENMIEGIDFGLFYAGIVGQIPFLHRFLLGNMTLMNIRSRLAPHAPDPVATATRMVLKCLAEYDERDSESSDKRADFLAYLRGQEKSGGSRISTRDMMNHLMNNLLAGSDTTAISLRAVFYYVIRDRRVYEKLQQEIDEADKAGKLSRFVTFAESLELPYLQICLKEAMRMHPGVSYPLERIVPEGGVELCNQYLPAGTIVGVNAAVIHRDKTIFGTDADQFRPERWIQSESNCDVQNMERHLLTFGSGVRTCIGKNISIMEMGKFIPQILRQFHLEWASDKPTWDVKTWWFAKQSGMFVTFTTRNRS
ncbi:uncharacterized protein Z518_08891 [Rhinocladiella mackenziei CBS 650.93]|uniref:Uncharacterized protein n=1 Tax=Rhinocladiella mackenziei CBS 650.93 TaxID=1442369 RepID=A0A0D2ID57_9EURO|nr:uncharacterized protein Z518_08891 [Rhinocladiella mackenziei CBS 650.93]KIX01166.1 hypothetical protein Z518_08891 [Rhinocladiella mackenziei CBS 650.93]